MRRLRDPKGGCPWDLQQDYRSIAPSTIEEAYEVVDAIESGDFDHLREELGDLLFQVVFYAQLAAEEERFNFDDIAAAISNKLLRRHPHVFPDGTLNSRVDDNNRPSEAFVTQQWENIKAEERAAKGQSGLLDNIPTGLPELTRARKLQKRAAEIGFDWPDAQGVMQKLREEVAELDHAIENGRVSAIEDELGDCFFTLVNMSRHLNCDAGAVLRRANQKFYQRFQKMEARANQQATPLADLSSEELEKLWQWAKGTASTKAD